MERSERSIFSVFFLCCGVNHIILSQESIHVAAASKTLAEKELRIKKKKIYEATVGGDCKKENPV